MMLFIISEVSEADLTREVFHYLKTIHTANSLNATGYLSLAYLHTSFPLSSFDRTLSNSLKEMNDGKKGEEKGTPPIVGFVGVKGSSGFAIDVVPVGKRRIEKGKEK